MHNDDRRMDERKSETMEAGGGGNPKSNLLYLPWAVLRWIGRLIRRFFVVLGVLVALVVVGYV